MKVPRTKLAPKNILYVGDRVGVDIVPARKAGMKTALISPINDHEEADFLCSDITGIERLVLSKK